MSSSSAIPPGGVPRRGVPSSNGPTPSKGQTPADSAWPLPRKPVPGTETATLTGRRVRNQEPEMTPSSRTGAQGASEQGNTRLNARGRPPEGAEDEIPILAPAALNPFRQAQNATKAPPSTATRGQPEKGVPNFPIPRPPAPRPLRPEPSGPVPPPLNPARAAASQQAPIPGSLRKGPPAQGPPAPATAQSLSPFPPPSRAGQPRAGPLPDQPGPAPSIPVPTPTKSPKRINTPVNAQRSGQERPPPLRVGNVPPDTQQQGSAAFPEPNAGQRGGPSIPRNLPAVPDSNRPGPRPASAGLQSRAGPADPSARKPVNQNPLGSSPPRPVPSGMLPGAFPPGTNPLRSSPPNPGQQQGNLVYANPLRSSPPNPQLQSGNQADPRPSVYRPSMVSPPARRQDTANFGPPPVTSPPRQVPSAGPQPQVTSPPGFSGARPGPSYSGPHHGHSSSLDSNMSNDSMASSATATSTRPLNPPQRQNTGFSKPARQNTDLREKGIPGGGGYYPGETGSAQTPYMNMLLSLDRIPRMHNILVSVFVWILLAGFVIIPGSFTSIKRKQEGQTVEIAVSTRPDAEKLALTPANTAAMVVGFVCIVAGSFGSAWLALRWRRNYVWLLNKLYLPLVLNALAGLLATLVGVYTQQAGEWSTQAIITVVIEGSIFVVNVVLFFVYNYWLLQRLRSDHEEAVGGGMEKKERRKRKKRKGGFFARFRRARKKRPIAAGSIV